ncbi:MAG: ribbon-helix-helix domain-containing protein [Alphaproteobacteria bacterium]|nr:ribbon-helix-helix domain-containing protein [Alphaproteobacteria bacterium]
MKKHSVNILGHATSITLEEPFWEELKRCAARRGCSLSALITEIDDQRTTQNSTTNQSTNLSSAIRVYILKMLQDSLAQ